MKRWLVRGPQLPTCQQRPAGSRSKAKPACLRLRTFVHALKHAPSLSSSPAADFLEPPLAPCAPCCCRYAVAWYPVYRIPDAPLVARFLTFHSFAPLVSSIQNTLAALQEGQQRCVFLSACPRVCMRPRVVHTQLNTCWTHPQAIACHSCFPQAIACDCLLAHVRDRRPNPPVRMHRRTCWLQEDVPTRARMGSCP